MSQMTLSAVPPAGAENGGDAAPVCIKDYATDETLIAKTDPLFPRRRYNSIPVRIIIDKDGKVKHVHLISAFPDQAKAITDALAKWRFKPYVLDGQPVEVETGVMFGPPARPAKPPQAVSSRQ
jgi:protein TonB